MRGWIDAAEGGDGEVGKAVRTSSPAAQSVAQGVHPVVDRRTREGASERWSPAGLGKRRDGRGARGLPVQCGTRTTAIEHNSSSGGKQLDNATVWSIQQDSRTCRNTGVAEETVPPDCARTQRRNRLPQRALACRRLCDVAIGLRAWTSGEEERGEEARDEITTRLYSLDYNPVVFRRLQLAHKV